MPFVKKIEIQGGQIGIWEIQETVNELLKQIILSNNERIAFEKITAEKRKKEFLITRILLQFLLSAKHEIEYQKEGKPNLKNSALNISISHSSQFVVLFLSRKNCGIDVENTSRNIEKVAQRFLHPTEKEQIKKSDTPGLTTFIYWSAKEAIFKCTPHKNIEFGQQIFINYFETQEKGTFTAKLVSENQISNYRLNYFLIRNNVLVYCVED